MSLCFGRYETIRELASGGMGTVYLARAVGEGGFERLVALKVMHKHVAEQPEFESMFLDEARLAARIRHPNVVGTIDVQRAREGLFLVMELVEGPSLQDLVRHLGKSKQSLPVEIALRITVDTLAGLHAAHELTGPDGLPLQLVHRDVSPPNIMLGYDGVVKLTDFGVARAEARLSTTVGGQVKGKYAYMPPEQGVGDAIDRRADVYAVGVVLWEMLTGTRLFKAEHEVAIVAQILTGAQRTPRQVNEAVAPEIDAVCMKALAVETPLRFATAAEFADALEEAASAAGVRMASVRQLARYLKGVGLEGGHAGEDSKMVTLLRPSAPDVTPTSQMSPAAAVLSAPPKGSARRLGAVAAVVMIGAAALAWLLLPSRGAPATDTLQAAPSQPSEEPQTSSMASVVPPPAATSMATTSTVAPALTSPPSATIASAAPRPSAFVSLPRAIPHPPPSTQPSSAQPPQPKSGDPSGFRPDDL